MKKKKIAAAILATVMTVSTLSTGGLFQTKVSKEITAEAATDPYGDAYDPVLVDDNDTVIVVDPGHGGSDSGATGNGFKEKDLALDIATALRDRLEEYRNVKVFMTRSEDYYVGLTARTDYAASVGADAFVSVHLNSATSSSAHGAEVYYPNSSYDYDAYTTGKAMAGKVLAALVNMGLTSRGYTYKNSQSGAKYPDGSTSDYLAVIRGSKLHHIPAILIEGAFISNKSDVSNYLNSDEKTTTMGSTDADAVAAALGLTLRDGSEILPGVTTLTSAQATGQANNVRVTWNQAANVSEYVVYRKTGSNGKWKEVGRTADTSYTDTTGSYGTTYYYTVIGRNDNGRAESYDTTGLNVTTPRKDIVAKSAVDNGLDRVRVTWEADPDATGYRVYRKTTGSYKKITTIQKQSTSYTDETVARNTTYHYCVKSYKKVNGINIWSTYRAPGVTVTTDADPISTLNAAPAADNKSISFSWEKSADPDVTYRIYKKTDDGKYTRVYQAAPGAELKYTDTDIAPDTTYKYRLRFFRKGLHDTSKTFWSSYSNVVTFTTPADPAAEQSDQTPQTANVQKAATETDDSKDTTKSSDTKTTTKADNKTADSKTTARSSASKTTTKSTAAKKNSSTIVMKDAIERGLGRVALHWSASVPYKNSKEKVYYRVYRKDSTGKYTNIMDVTTKYATDPAAVATSYDNPVTFTYRVRSYFLNGKTKVWSPYSDEVSVTMSGSQVKWRSAYTAVKSSTDKTNYDADSKDYVTPASATSLTLHWTPVTAATGYQILDENGKRITSVKGSATNSYTMTGLKERTTYTYMVRAYKVVKKKNYFGIKSLPASGTTAYVIKGKSNTNPAQMARYYNANITKKKNNEYPADVYGDYGAPTINDFTQIVYEEANKVGIRAEILFAQICKETNFLTFGGDVSAEQCNFGGIGATGNKNPGIDFVKYAEYYYSALGYSTPDEAVSNAVRVGVRAQAVHLALYASNDGDAPNFASVTAVNSYPNIGSVVIPDPRAGSWLVGYAPYVEWLGIKDNYYTTGEFNGTPVSKGWAAANNYGYSLVSDYIEPLLRS